MTNREEKAMRFILGKKRFEQSKSPQISSGFFGMTWYLDSWWEKLAFVLGFFALIWTIFELVFLGRL